MLKNIDQKLAGKHCIYINTSPLIFCKTDILLDHDQSTGLDFSHIKAGLDQFIYSLVCKTLLYFLACIKQWDRRHDLFLSKLFQHFTKLWLKNNDHCSNQHSRQILYDPENGAHLENICNKNKPKNYQDTLQQCICTGEFDPNHELIYKE